MCHTFTIKSELKFQILEEKGDHLRNELVKISTDMATKCKNLSEEIRRKKVINDNEIKSLKSIHELQCEKYQTETSDLKETLKNIEVNFY